MNARVHAASTLASFDAIDAERFIRGESMLAVIIDDPVADVCERLERAATEGNYQVAVRQDLTAAQPQVQGRGVTPGHTVVVYELGRCSLQAQLLAADPSMAHALPLRVVVHDAHGITTVTTPRPSVFWPDLSHAPQVVRMSRQVEQTLQSLLQSLQQAPACNKQQASGMTT